MVKFANSHAHIQSRRAFTKAAPFSRLVWEGQDRIPPGKTCLLSRGLRPANPVRRGSRSPFRSHYADCAGSPESAGSAGFVDFFNSAGSDADITQQATFAALLATAAAAPRTGAIRGVQRKGKRAGIRDTRCLLRAKDPQPVQKGRAMKRVMFALMAATVVTASSSGCCCMDRVFYRPWGCSANRCSACDGYGGGGCTSNGGGCSSCGGGSNCANGCGALGAVGSGWNGWGAWGGWQGGCAGNQAIGGLPTGADGNCGCANCVAARNAKRHQHQARARAAGGDEYGGPPSGQVSYPYYTNRGPRDFLAKNPPSIGP